MTYCDNSAISRHVVVLICLCVTTSALISSKDACLQIFSVPKQNVECDPSQEVMDHLVVMETSLTNQGTSLGVLSSKVESMDPEANRKLRDAVREKLQAIDGMSDDIIGMAIQQEHSQTQILALMERIASLETSNKAEVAALIKMQTELIMTMWDQTNSSIHEKYISNLNQTVTNFLIRLDSLESNVQDKLASLENKMADMASVVERWQNITPRAIKVHDCDDALRFYHPISGVYSINPGPALQPYDVYCDMGVPSEGWTVIQRRMDGSVDFFRGWSAYQAGFGDASGEYWLGLEKIRVLTRDRECELRVDLQDWNGRWWWARYDSFSIGAEDTDYALHVSGYSGDAGDSLTYHHDMPFSTIDRNNDLKDGLCSTWCHGAWWYKDCFLSNLNGRYYQGGPYIPETNWGDGVNWKTTYKTYYYSFRTASMKIRAKT